MKDRINKLQGQLVKENLDAVFISSVPNIVYLTGFSGFSKEERDAFLFITQKEQYLFTHALYTEAAKKHIKHFILIPMTRDNPTSLAIKKIIEQNTFTKIGYEAFDLRVIEFHALTKRIDEKLLIPTSIINEIRIIKTPNEIEAIHTASNIGDQVFEEITRKVRLEMTEKQLANEIDYAIRDKYADVAFPTIVAFGDNAAHPHHVPSEKKLIQNELILVDFGVKKNNYCSDMSRTFFYGKATAGQKKVYHAVLASQQKAIEYLSTKLASKEKVTASQADKVARESLIQADYPSIPHALGHGIGIQVHESPALSPHSDEPLTEGMVFSLEPGVYLPKKVGVRIEDLFAIQNNKLVQLTNASRELIEI